MRMSAPDAMRRIAEKIVAGEVEVEGVTAAYIDGHMDTAGIPDPDLIIRTSGEKRLSNYLMWQSAYSELVFRDELWPDFTREAFEAALDEYAARRRRFGGR